MDGLQPTFFSTGNPQINFQFHLIEDGSQIAVFLFKSWAVDAFQPQAEFSEFIVADIESTELVVDEIPDRVEDAQLTVGESISTWGVATKSTFTLKLNGIVFFEGLVEASAGCPPAVLDGTWTRIF